MDNFDRKSHWEKIYQKRELKKLSWFQEKPDVSLDFIQQFNLAKDAKIIDIGGGDCLLVDHLLDLGFKDITVLDISESAIERAKTRLGNRATMVKWIVTDVTHFEPTEQYDFWHDRAAFHFLTEEKDINTYIDIVRKALTEKGILLLGTFSEEGPDKCSGIEIKQYSEESMSKQLKQLFDKIKCIRVEHVTPFETIQKFIFCSFKLQA